MRAVSAREGGDAARTLRPAGGTPPEITGLLEQVQADHTPADVIVVDERHRLPVGRPYVTAAIDVASRCVAGLVVTLEAWSRQVSLRAPEWRGRVNRALRIDPRSLHSVEYTDRP